MVLPIMERSSYLDAYDDIAEPLEKIECYMATKVMKAVATLSASNATTARI